MTSTPDFQRSNAQLEGIAQQQLNPRAAVDAGELWMDADVAENRREAMRAGSQRTR